MFRTKSIHLLSAATLLLASTLAGLITRADTASAQSLPGASEPVTIIVAPSTPRPNTNVDVTLQSFSVDLSRSDITWTVNGKTFREGKGVVTISVPAGTAGSATTISAGVTTPDLGSFFVERTFRPGEVTLLLKSDGYAPPFYKGRSLESYGSAFRVTAVPEIFTAAGKRVDPKTLVYTWRKNGTVDGSQSGYGKDFFVSSQSSFVRDGDEISVSVSNEDNSFSAVRTIVVSPVVPEVLLYEESPLYGPLFETALTDVVPLDKEEMTVRAEFFNMSFVTPAAGVADMDWSINGSQLADWIGKRNLTVRKTDGVSGQSEVMFNIQHASRMLQAGRAVITILQ